MTYHEFPDNLRRIEITIGDALGVCAVGMVGVSRRDFCCFLVSVFFLHFFVAKSAAKVVFITGLLTSRFILGLNLVPQGGDYDDFLTAPINSQEPFIREGAVKLQSPFIGLWILANH